MSPDEMKSTIRNYLTELWQSHNIDVVDSIFHPNIVMHGPQPAEGLAVVKQALQYSTYAFSEASIEFHHQVVENDIVVTHFTVSAKHTDEFAGVKPTGNVIHTKSILIQRFENGLIVEDWPNIDFFGTMQQLGFKLVFGDG